MLGKTQEQIMQLWVKKEPCKVSVICVTYNHEKYISMALDSILMQETNFPFEIIIHDDLSTDNTREIISEYVRKYPQLIKTILQKNNTYPEGSSPLIRAMLDAGGDYIAICEGDDYWVDAKKLEKQINIFNDNSDCRIVSHRVHIKNDTITTQPYEPYVKYNQNTYKFEDVLNGHFIPSLSILFRKDMFPIYDPFYLKDIICRDIAIELILLRSGFGVHLKEEMGVYRHHDSGLTKKKRECLEIFNQYVRMLDIVAKWVGDTRRNKLSQKKIYFTLKKEVCLLKEGSVFAGLKFVYLCISRPIISIQCIFSVIRYRIQ